MSYKVACGLLVVCSAGHAAAQVAKLPPPEGRVAVGVRGQDVDEDWTDRLDPRRMVASVKKAAGYGPDREIAERLFHEGEELFVKAAGSKDDSRRDGFVEAAGKYESAAGRWPDSRLEEDALFMLAESYFFADRYPPASETFETLIKKFPNTRHMDTIDQRRFALARYWVEHHEANPDLPVTPNLMSKDRPLFDKFGNGVRVFDKIRFDDPTGKLADDATMAAGLAHFKQGHFVRADELFSDLRRSFPNSEHQFLGHLFGLQCKLKIYQGPQYSQLPMDEAEKMVKQIHRQFPQEAEENREFLEKVWQEVRLNQAQHDWETARYYHKRKEHAAARQYYERVRTDFSDTSLAAQATAELAALGGAPDKPEQALPWLARLFPTPDREKPLVARGAMDALRR